MIEVKGKAGPIAVDDGGTGESACLLVHSLGGRLAFWESTLPELRRSHTAMFATDARALLLRYPGPVRLIVDAANDSPMSLHAQLPDLDIVSIEGASHWLMLDRPEQFALALKEFVDAQSVPQ